jgi:hypothetical protein
LIQLLVAVAVAVLLNMLVLDGELVVLAVVEWAVAILLHQETVLLIQVAVAVAVATLAVVKLIQVVALELLY